MQDYLTILYNINYKLGI